MAATVNLKGGSFERGAVKPLFQAPPNNVRYSYAVSADDKRFLIDTVPRQASSSSTPITVVVNWTAGLKQ